MDPMGMFSASVPRQRVQSQHLLPLAGLPWPCWGAWGQETVRSSASPSTVSPQVTIKQCMAGAQNYHQTAQVITLDTTLIMNLQSSSIFTIVTIVHVRIRMGKKELSYAAMAGALCYPLNIGLFFLVAAVSSFFCYTFRIFPTCPTNSVISWIRYIFLMNLDLVWT